MSLEAKMVFCSVSLDGIFEVIKSNNFFLSLVMTKPLSSVKSSPIFNCCNFFKAINEIPSGSCRIKSFVINPDGEIIDL
ncbi:hypothetical protein D3C85_774590 [compost metagenome]